MLLVDADQAEVRHRREDCRAAPTTTGASPATIRSRSSRRSASVRPEWSTAIRSPKRLEAAERLRRQGDLGHEHDCALAARERRRAGLEVDLGLAAPGRAGEQQVRAAASIASTIRATACSCGSVSSGSLAGLPAPSAALAAPRARLRRDELERPPQRRAVVVREPERSSTSAGGGLVEDASIGAARSARAPRRRSRRPPRARPSGRSGSRRPPRRRRRPAPRT